MNREPKEFHDDDDDDGFSIEPLGLSPATTSCKLFDVARWVDEFGLASGSLQHIAGAGPRVG